MSNFSEQLKSYINFVGKDALGTATSNELSKKNEQFFKANADIDPALKNFINDSTSKFAKNKIDSYQSAILQEAAVFSYIEKSSLGNYSKDKLMELGAEKVAAQAITPDQKVDVVKKLMNGLLNETKYPNGIHYLNSEGGKITDEKYEMLAKAVSAMNSEVKRVDIEGKSYLNFQVDKFSIVVPALFENDNVGKKSSKELAKEAKNGTNQSNDKEAMADYIRTSLMAKMASNGALDNKNQNTSVDSLLAGLQELDKSLKAGNKDDKENEKKFNTLVNQSATLLHSELLKPENAVELLQNLIKTYSTEFKGIISKDKTIDAHETKTLLELKESLKKSNVIMGLHNVTGDKDFIEIDGAGKHIKIPVTFADDSLGNDNKNDRSK